VPTGQGERLGSERTGGTFPLTDAEHLQILALGWVVPDRKTSSSGSDIEDGVVR